MGWDGEGWRRKRKREKKKEKREREGECEKECVSKHNKKSLFVFPLCTHTHIHPPSLTGAHCTGSHSFCQCNPSVWPTVQLASSTPSHTVTLPHRHTLDQPPLYQKQKNHLAKSSRQFTLLLRGDREISPVFLLLLFISHLSLSLSLSLLLFLSGSSVGDMDISPKVFQGWGRGTGPWTIYGVRRERGKKGV